MRFSIRDLMFFTALVAVAVACLVDRWNVAAKLEDRKASLERTVYESDMRNLKAQIVRKRLEEQNKIAQ